MVDEHPIVSVLRKHINVKVTVTDPFEIEKGMLRRFAIATGDTDPIYHDEDYARSSTYGEIISPPTFPFEWNHHAHGVAQLDISGDIFRELGIRPSGLRAENDYEIIEPTRPGDVITTTSFLSDVYQKQGRSGLLVFYIVESHYHNQKDVLMAIARDTMVFVV